MRTQLLELVTVYQEKMRTLQKATTMSACDLEFNQKFHALISAFIEEHVPVETDGKDHRLDMLNILTTLRLMPTGLTKEMIEYITKPIMGDLAAVKFVQSLIKAKYSGMGNNVLHQAIVQHDSVLKNLNALREELATPLFNSSLGEDSLIIRVDLISQLIDRII